MPATATLIKMPGVHALPNFVDKNDREVMQTVFVDAEILAEWKRPKLQRPLQLSRKVYELAEAMQLEAAKDPDEAWCRIPGVITLGKVLEKDYKGTYLLDGQHRIDGALKLACGPILVPGGVSVRQALTNAREKTFDTFAEMGTEFANLNSQLVATKPDDILRALSEMNPHLADIEKACPFIGYDRTGKHKETVLLSMSAALRTWFGSGGLVPASGPPARDTIKYCDDTQTAKIIDFYSACAEAGWALPTLQRLWSTLNLSINMWLWRRVVLGESVQRFHGGQAPLVLERKQYVECMREVASTKAYIEWLGGRSLRYQDRQPCYGRLKDMFTERLAKLGRTSPRFPMAEWG